MMSTSPSVSVIIPTFRRPQLLKETLASVWAQTLPPEEILIGDDSPDDVTEQLVKGELAPASRIPIRYFHHRPSLREAGNVDFLYGHATGELVLHLHDDDPVFPRCLELLKGPLMQHSAAVASFGLQRVLDESGQPIPDGEKVNLDYFRTPERAGLVDGFMAGAVSMFPNNGFLIRREAACAVGYADHGRAGLAADFYFGFRLGRLGRPFYFVNELTAMARLTSQSLSRANDADGAYKAVKIILQDLAPSQLTPEIETCLRNKMPLAITTAARRKERKLALQWLFSRYYRSRLPSLRGVKRLWLTLRP